jgi:thioredoxin 1
MATKNVLEINDRNFDTEVLASKEPFLLDFTATWCGPCRMLAPIVERIADENVGSIRVGTIDIDESPGVAARYGIRGAPTVVAFAGGRETGRHVGTTNKERLLKLVAG